MTNYADPNETKAVEIGPCRCPEPSGHDTDTAVIRTRFGYGDLGFIRQAARSGGPEAAKVTTIVRGVTSWNLVLPGGKPRPIDLAQANFLDEITVERLCDLLDDAFAEDPVPNPSGDPSPDGSPTDDTHTPETPQPPSSTTR